MNLYKKDLQEDEDASSGGDAKHRHKTRMMAVEAMSLVEGQHKEVLEEMNMLLLAAQGPTSSAPLDVEHAARPAMNRFASTSTLSQKQEFAREKTRYATNLVLLEQREVVQHLLHEGLMDELDEAPLVQLINRKIEKIMLEPILETVQNRNEDSGKPPGNPPPSPSSTRSTSSQKRRGSVIAAATSAVTAVAESCAMGGNVVQAGGQIAAETRRRGGSIVVAAKLVAPNVRELTKS